MKNIYYIIIIFVLVSCNQNDRYKKYIINNSDKFEKITNDTYVLDSIDGYHTEISIAFHNDSSYTIILWGDRNSYLWYLRKDYKISASIPFDRYKRKDISKDLEIINKFKSTKK